jgi:quinol monooxygenase YgiN
MEDWLMTAFNVVRVRVKPGREDEFIEAHRRASPDLPGFQRGVLLKTGERAYCMIGEWDSMDALAAARPTMGSVLATFRDTLEELEHGLGISDPVSGEVILDSREDPHSRACAEAMA